EEIFQPVLADDGKGFGVHAVNWTGRYSHGRVKGMSPRPIPSTGLSMHPSLEGTPSSCAWQSLRQQIEVLRNEVETLSRQAEAGEVDVSRLHSAGNLSHRVSQALLALQQQQELERIVQHRDLLKREYVEKARRELRFQDLDLAQLQAESAGPVPLLG